MRDPIRIEGVGELMLRLREVFPREIEKAARLAASDTGRAAKAEAGRIARSAYTAKRPQKITARLRKAGMGAELMFSGKLGEQLHHFAAKPRGITKRKPDQGVMVRVRKDGGFRLITGPAGQKTFWFRGKNSGAMLIGYRPGKGRTISTKNMLGASQIQAVARRRSSDHLQKFAEEKLEAAMLRHLERFFEGQL